MLEEDGRLRHADQCLVAEPGVPPTFPVMRALRDALTGDDGTVLHCWDHEQNVENDIRRQLENSALSDRDDLLAFVGQLLGGDSSEGRLQDLGRLVKDTVFFKSTSGSSSIKKVLPAVLAQSEFLKERYGKPIYGTAEMPSLNFPEAWGWLVERNGHIEDPYKLLDPRVLRIFSPKVLAQIEDEPTANGGFIAHGGAAMTAYAQLQNPTISDTERARIEDELKRYCELDTLAMVMIFEALDTWIRINQLTKQS